MPQFLARLPAQTWLLILGVVLVFIAYTITLWVALGTSLPVAMAGGAANTVPVVVFGAAVRHIIVTRLVGKRPVVQFAGHALLAVGFSLLSYWLLIVLLGLVNSTSPLNFMVRSMITSGMAWQMLENFTTYVAIAALTYVMPAPGDLPAADFQPETQEAPSGDRRPSRFLVRTGDEFHPIEVGEIVSIAGADDYAELSTVDGRRLASMTLAEFESSLDPVHFVRVHRSRIVNLEHVTKAEPAGGGRLLLHMDNGELISTSRTGAHALKSRAI